MDTTRKIYWQCLLVMAIGVLVACSESDIPEIPDHKLDVEFSYELVCSDALLKYVTPEVTFTDAKGVQHTVSIESGMWEGNEHKTLSGFWEDSTRLPEYYDGTYHYLRSLGLAEI